MDWDRRYHQQAKWTRELRRHAYQQFGFFRLHRILDVGCGTGALLTELPSFTPAACFGLDISLPNLLRASQTAPSALLTCADAHTLPYASETFDAVFCHFTLLWLKDPQTVLHEMVRVTRFGGVILALAEPDYGGRIDYPPELQALGAAQTESLRQQGADPEIGRKLSSLLHECGLTQVETGVLSGSWTQPPSTEDLDLEWQVVESDIQNTSLNLAHLRRIDEQAWAYGKRTLFVPTFYGWGIKP